MANLLRRAMQQGAGQSVNLVISLHVGDSVSGRDLITGVNSASKKVLSWAKSRTSAAHHALTDTVRGATKQINSSTTNAETTEAEGLQAFLSNGITVGDSALWNGVGQDYVLSQFMAEEGFLDIVEYTGNLATTHLVPHDVGTTVGMVMVKNLDTTDDFAVQHKDMAGNQYLRLGTANSQVPSAFVWNNVNATPTNLRVGASTITNGSGNRHIAYIFAHNPDKGIYCGSYAGNGSPTGPILNFGWQCRFILIKVREGVSGSWLMFDTIRGIVVGLDARLYANQSTVETSINYLELTLTGVQIKSGATEINLLGATYIYMAIR